MRRAFTLLYQGHAQVVSTDGSNNYLTHDFTSWRDFSRANPEPEMVHTISVSIRIPRIIVLLLFERLPKKEVKFTRHNVFERDRNTCQYCGEIFERHELNLDHVLPRDRGGQTTWENIVCSCIPQYEEEQPASARSRASANSKADRNGARLLTSAFREATMIAGSIFLTWPTGMWSSVNKRRNPRRTTLHRQHEIHRRGKGEDGKRGEARTGSSHWISRFDALRGRR